MRKASFSVEKVSTNTDAHNTREHKPKYLIGCESGCENEYIKYYDYNNFQELAESRYMEVNKQKMQTSQKENLFEEAVISLEEHHTKEDVENLFKSLNKKYTGHTLINLAIHRDEGHFEKDGIEYYPSMHIIQKDDNEWYILDENDDEIIANLNDKNFKPKAEDFKIKVDINDFNKVYNYHAHAVFSRFDLETGKSARFQKKDMSERYKFVAEQMQMNYAPDSSSRFIKKTIGQHKGDLSAIRNAKLVIKKELEKELIEVKEEVKTLKFDKKELEKQLKELNSKLRAELQQNGALRADYAQLEALNKELKEQLKNKELTFEELHSKFDNLEKSLLKKEDEITALTSANKQLKEQNISLKSENQELIKSKDDVLEQNKTLEAQKEALEEKVIALEEKVATNQNMSDYEELKEELIDNKENIEVFEKTYELPKTGNLAKLLTWIDDKFNKFKEIIKAKDYEIAVLTDEISDLKREQSSLLNSEKGSYLNQIVDKYSKARTGTDKSEALNLQKTEVKKADLSRFINAQKPTNLFLDKLNAIDEQINDNTKTNTRRGRDR